MKTYLFSVTCSFVLIPEVSFLDAYSYKITKLLRYLWQWCADYR